jgi:hypothetical protein
MKNAVFWGVKPCSSYKHRCFGGRIASTTRVTRIGELRTTLAVIIYYLVFLRSVLRLLLAANVVPNSLIPVTLMMAAICSSATSVLTGSTRRNILGDGILLN